MARPDRARRGGFAVPIAIVMLIAIALLAALMIEGAVAEVKTGGAVSAQSRIDAALETSVAALMANRLDSAGVAAAPPGSVVSQSATSGADSAIAAVQLLAPGLAKLRVVVQSRPGSVRVIAGRIAFLRIVPDSLHPGELKLEPLAPNWWVATP